VRKGTTIVTKVNAILRKNFTILRKKMPFSVSKQLQGRSRAAKKRGGFLARHA